MIFEQSLDELSGMTSEKSLTELSGRMARLIKTGTETDLTKCDLLHVLELTLRCRSTVAMLSLAVVGDGVMDRTVSLDPAVTETRGMATVHLLVPA